MIIYFIAEVNQQYAGRKLGKVGVKTHNHLQASNMSTLSRIPGRKPTGAGFELPKTALVRSYKIRVMKAKGYEPRSAESQPLKLS